MGPVERYEIDVAAERAGVSVDALQRLVALDILQPDPEGRFTPGDVRRAELVESLAAAGISLDALGVSQAVVDASGVSDVAFREIGPVELKGVGGAVHLHAASRAG